MRTHHLPGLRLRRGVRTTVLEPANAKVEDLVKRDFTAPAANVKYVGDITYLPLACGRNLYLATVIDCYSRRLVGWAVADHVRTDLITDALKDAAATRGSLSGAIFHGDHGAQYTSRAYAELCIKLGVRQSMGAVGSSTDNALAESFNATLKRELLHGAAAWSDELSSRRDVFRWPPATTPEDATPGAANKPRTPTRPSTALPSSTPPNHQKRVQDQGSRPIDCYSPRLVGWSIADHMRTELVADALRAAVQQRGSLRGAVFHSDHGAQYGSRDYAQLCHQLGVKRSMGAVGTSADNALAESFNAVLKRETRQGAAHWDTAAQARLEVFTWITRYNTRRRHSFCGQLSPVTYEQPSTTTALQPAT